MGKTWLLAPIVCLAGGFLGSVLGFIVRFLLQVRMDPYGEPFTILPIPFAFLPVIPICGSVLGILGGLLVIPVSRLPFLVKMKPGIVIVLTITIGLICGCLASLLFTPQAL